LPWPTQEAFSSNLIQQRRVTPTRYQDLLVAEDEGRQHWSSSDGALEAGGKCEGSALARDVASRLECDLGDVLAIDDA
jgi:hypothetical protein